MWRTNSRTTEVENANGERRNRWFPLHWFSRVTGQYDTTYRSEPSYLPGESSRLSSRVAGPMFMRSMPNIRESSRSSSSLVGTQVRHKKISGPRRAVSRDNLQEGSRALPERGHLLRERSTDGSQRQTKKKSPRVTPSKPIHSILKWNKVDIPPVALAPPQGSGQTIPTRGQPSSPIRRRAMDSEPIISDVQRTPSRTFTRLVKPVDIINVPEIKNSRLSLRTVVGSPLFIGGGTIEGEVHVVVEGNKPRWGHRLRLQPVQFLRRATVDVLGVETCNSKHHIFRTLALELIDSAHPPPAGMVASVKTRFDESWEIVPSTSKMPFRLNLPVNMGPPPYRSRLANIKYILCTTLTLQAEGQQYYVRDSQEIPILTIHDPETALLNLPHPLTASNALTSLGDHFSESIELTAGVHRQTWVSGMALFVDVRIENRTQKNVKKVEVQLERATTFFHHSVMGSSEHFRLPDRTERKVVATNIYHSNRYPPRFTFAPSQDERTLKLDIPAGLATISTGCYFGVRYFLSIVLRLSSTYKNLSVQIPISIIHPNSLDILPNSLAQVASALEHAHRQKESRGRSEQDDSEHTSYGNHCPVLFEACKGLTDVVAKSDQIYIDTWDYIPSPSSQSSPLVPPLLPPSCDKTIPVPVRKKYRYVPGSAFSAPRRRSLEKMKGSGESSQTLGQSPSTDETESPKENLSTKENRKVSFNEPEKFPTRPAEGPLCEVESDNNPRRQDTNYSRPGNGLTNDEIVSLTQDLDGSPRKRTTRQVLRDLDSADKRVGRYLEDEILIARQPREHEAKEESSSSPLVEYSNDFSLLSHMDSRRGTSREGREGLTVSKNGDAEGSTSSQVYPDGGAQRWQNFVPRDGTTSESDTTKTSPEPSIRLQRTKANAGLYKHNRTTSRGIRQCSAAPTLQSCPPSTISGVDISIYSDDLSAKFKEAPTRSVVPAVPGAYEDDHDNKDMLLGGPGPDVGEFEPEDYDLPAIESSLERQRCSADTRYSGQSNSRSRNKNRSNSRCAPSMEYREHSNEGTVVKRGGRGYDIGLGPGSKTQEGGTRYKQTLANRRGGQRHGSKEGKVENNRTGVRRESGKGYHRRETNVRAGSSHTREHYDHAIGKAKGKVVVDDMHVLG